MLTLVDQTQTVDQHVNMPALTPLWRLTSANFYSAVMVAELNCA